MAISALGSDTLPAEQRAAIAACESNGYAVTAYTLPDVELVDDEGHWLAVDELGCVHGDDPFS